MKSIKFIIALAVFSFISFSFANTTNVDMEEGDGAMQIALQKNLYEILISDTLEIQAEYREKKSSYKNESLIPYEKILKEICDNYNAKKCPEVYLTDREGKGLASMGPTGILSLNEQMLKKININEATFIIAHEYAHYKLSHSKERMKVIAKSISDHAIMIREPEQALAISMMLPNVKEAHYKYENEADAYAFNYINNNKIKIDCEKMFLSILNGKVISTDNHESFEKRCENHKR